MLKNEKNKGIYIHLDPNIGRRAEIREHATKSENTRSGFLINYVEMNIDYVESKRFHRHEVR